MSLSFMNTSYFLFLMLSTVSGLLHSVNNEYSDHIVEEMRNNLTVLMDSMERMQSQMTIMDLKNKLQENRLLVNISQLQSELRTVELQNMLINRTIEVQQRILIDQKQNITHQENKLNAQEMELISLRQQLAETENKLNRSIVTSEINKLKRYLEDLQHNHTVMHDDQEKEFIFLRQQFAVTESKLNRTKLVQMTEDAKIHQVLKEVQLNQTLSLRSQQAVLDTFMGELNASKSRFTEVENNRQFLDRLENKVNKTSSAYNIVLNDVVDKLNMYKNESEKNLLNFTIGLADIQKQFHYVSLSALGTVNKLTALNTTALTWFQKLENQQLNLNSSTALTFARIGQQIQNISTSTTSSLNSIKHQLVGLNLTTVQWTRDARKALVDLNSTIQGEVRSIAFTVSCSHDLSNYNYKRVIYDKVITNIGNGYDVQTEVFTCPHGGTYVFTWSAMSKANKYCNTFIHRNGAQLLEAYSHEGNGGDNEVSSNTAVLSLSVGDRVWIQTTVCHYNFGYPFTAFSGWKL